MEKNSLQEIAASGASNAAMPTPEPSCVEMLEDGTQADSLLTETILSSPLNGHPYSVATMRQAAINLYGNNQNIVANKIYLRSKPSNETQLAALEASDAEWFDYPLDRDVLQQGDYYPQQGIGPEEIPWLYAVVDLTFTVPLGINYEVIENIYVPEIDLALEKEAFRITGNSAAYLQDCTITPMYPIPCDDPYNPECAGGGGGGGGTPPSPTKSPAGNITVEDTQLPGIAGDHKFPLRQVRVVCKRFLKIVTTYTDDNGHFAVAKKFHNKVHVIVKFKNNNIATRGIRGLNFWQMQFPVKYSLGKYSGTLNNISYTFRSGTNTNFKQHRNWWAAQLINAYFEYNEMAIIENVGQLPVGMNVLLSSWGAQSATGSTTMNNHRLVNPSVPNIDFVGYYLANPAVSSRFLVANFLVNNQFMRYIDMTYGYNTSFVWESDKVKQLMYHELSHAAHFNKVGESWYSGLATAELYTISRWGQNSPNSPYGIGDDGNISNIIAVGESWAEHLGQFFTDLRYSTNSSWDFNQGFFYFNGSIQNTSGTTVANTGLNAHVNLLEDYDPTRLNDNTRWIPYGIYYDLLDNRNDILFGRVPIDDQVTLYTNHQMFNALDNDIANPIAYRIRLLSENGNNQVTNLTSIFNNYGY